MSLLRPWEAGRPIERQVTARRMNDMQRAIKPVKFGGGAARVSHVGDETFITFRRIQPSAKSTHPLLPYNVSSGSIPFISVIPGTVTDLTNSGTVWGGSGHDITINDPVHGVVPFNVKIGGVYPKLQLDAAATCAYLFSTVEDATGYITAMEIDGDTGGGVPPNTSTESYIILSDLTVTIVGSSASVSILDDGPQSSLFYRVCEFLPLIDGSGYLYGT